MEIFLKGERIQSITMSWAMSQSSLPNIILEFQVMDKLALNHVVHTSLLRFPSFLKATCHTKKQNEHNACLHKSAAKSWEATREV